MSISTTSRNKAYAIKKSRVDISPFRGNMVLLREKISQYNNPRTRSKVGFTFTSSMKSMGLIPRANGKYTIGDKYRNL